MSNKKNRFSLNMMTMMRTIKTKKKILRAMTVLDLLSPKISQELSFKVLIVHLSTLNLKDTE